MTSVEFRTEDGKFVGVTCSGHSDYAEEGSDIVCAAVSSVVQTAVLGLMQKAGIPVVYEVNERDAYLSALLPDKLTERQAHDADVILATACLGVSDLYEQYSDFIHLEVK